MTGQKFSGVDASFFCRLLFKHPLKDRAPCLNKFCADAKKILLPNKFVPATFRVNEAVASASGRHHDLARMREIELGVII